MDQSAQVLVDWATFGQARAELGGEFLRIIGYFREDGVKSLGQIEDAIRARSAAALVRPAHTMKGESRQFGAERLADLAELIEMTARRCVETHETPDELIEHIARLRPLFDETMAAFDRELNPLVSRRPNAGFGRKQILGSGFGA